ncbi:MAG TPA: translation initiation factor IF-2 [Fimbriimonas sp.]|nr:translation initiation factor IF-2 [Fimbriimonas sp.]
MTSIADIAKEFEIRPGQVFTVLNDLGINHDGSSFEADKETTELVKDGCLEQLDKKVITLKPNSSPRDVAFALDVPQAEMQKSLISKFRIMKAIGNPLTEDEARKIVEGFGFEYALASAVAPKVAPKNAANMRQTGAITRPPVVTIMGHVDHGKTSLLDYIRKANVAGKEFGGITQHIGAYQVETEQGLITFLDTPGHAAFTQMRARGAQVTDIAILVVAADDGIMPQTIEAIQHIQAANVPMIVAVNKIDKEGANPDRVLNQLTEHNVIAEAYGGQTIVANVSALTGAGVPELLELILLQAEIMELKADPRGALRGTVIEAKLEKGRGPVATLLIEEGTLKAGDALVVGNTFGRIKAMTDYLGEKITEAAPSTPVEILGLNDVPSAGDKLEYYADERSARIEAEGRVDRARTKSLLAPGRGLTLRDLRTRMKDDGMRDLNLIVKADVQGSVEAVKGMLEKVKNAEVEAKIILSGVGQITKADIDLAAASESIVVGFNVKPEGDARKEAEKRKVEIRTYSIIYELIEDIEAAVKGMLKPKFEEQFIGEAEIRVRMQFSKKGVVAGCYITDGKVMRNAKARVYRGKELVHDGDIVSLKHFKDDVREMSVGQECGMTFGDWEDFQEGDRVEAFEVIQVNA